MLCDTPVWKGVERRSRSAKARANELASFDDLARPIARWSGFNLCSDYARHHKLISQCKQEIGAVNARQHDQR
jgi:hypothetical protein